MKLIEKLSLGVRMFCLTVGGIVSYLSGASTKSKRLKKWRSQTDSARPSLHQGKGINNKTLHTDAILCYHTFIAEYSGDK